MQPELSTSWNLSGGAGKFSACRLLTGFVFHKMEGLHPIFLRRHGNLRSLRFHGKTQWDTARSPFGCCAARRSGAEIWIGQSCTPHSVHLSTVAKGVPRTAPDAQMWHPQMSDMLDKFSGFFRV